MARAADRNTPLPGLPVSVLRCESLILSQMERMRTLLSICIILSGFLGNTQYKSEETQFRAPLDIPIILAGTFGELRSNHFHAGIDIKTQQRQGLPVFAIEEGTVSRIKVSHWGYGKVLYVAHPNGYTSVYAHLQKFSPEIEAYIKDLQYQKQSYEVEAFPDYGTLVMDKGDLIAYTGNTGGSSGPHLHFEIRNSLNEKPLNPLHYGFEVRDATNPTLQGVYAYPLSEEAQVNRSERRIKLPFRRQADGSYVTDTLIASGKVGFGVRTFDRQDLAANRNGIYRLRQVVDGSTYTDLEFASFSFGETRYINTLIDYPYYAQNNNRIMKCFRDAGNSLSMYNTVFEEGKLQVEEGRSYSVELEIADQAGNQTHLIIPVFGKRESPLAPAKEVKTPYFVRADKPANFKLEEAQVFFPANSFYESIHLDLNVTDSIVKVHSPVVPLHRNFTLSFDVSSVPEAWRMKTFIARLDAKNKPQYMRTFRRGKSFSTRSRELGRFTLARDTVPPKIRPRNFKPGQWLTNYRYLSLLISDDLSGVSSYSARLNGKWILMEYEPKTRTLTYNFDDRMSDARQCELEVTVIDNCGNASSFTTTVFRR